MLIEVRKQLRRSQVMASRNTKGFFYIEERFIIHLAKGDAAQLEGGATDVEIKIVWDEGKHLEYGYLLRRRQLSSRAVALQFFRL
jgi:hypothetical protein